MSCIDPYAHLYTHLCTVTTSFSFVSLSFRLKFVFGPCALQALDLVDQRSVTCLSSPSGRKAFQVRPVIHLFMLLLVKIMFTL